MAAITFLVMEKSEYDIYVDRNKRREICFIFK